MKKSFAILALVVTFSSCDKDDELEGGIEGRWALVDYQLTNESLDEEIPFTSTSTLVQDDFVLQLDADGSYEQEGSIALISSAESDGEDLGSQSVAMNLTRTGTYEVTDDEITGIVLAVDPNFPGISSTSNPYTVDLSGNELNLAYSATGTTIINYTEEVDFEIDLNVSFVRE